MDSFAWTAEPRIPRALEGGVPPEVELRKQVEALHATLATIPEGEEKDGVRRQIHDKVLCLALLSKMGQ